MTRLREVAPLCAQTHSADLDFATGIWTNLSMAGLEDLTKNSCTSMPRHFVQAFAGSLEGVRARKGVLITTSTLTLDARSYVDRIEKRIVLIDGEMLAELMLDHEIGVDAAHTYTVPRLDEDYFERQ
jgi:restriction endonuclease Mrr